MHQTSCNKTLQDVTLAHMSTVWRWQSHRRFVCRRHCLQAWSKLCDVHSCSRSLYRSSLKCKGLPRLKQQSACSWPRVKCDK